MFVRVPISWGPSRVDTVGAVAQYNTYRNIINNRTTASQRTPIIVGSDSNYWDRKSSRSEAKISPCPSIREVSPGVTDKVLMLDLDECVVHTFQDNPVLAAYAAGSPEISDRVYMLKFDSETMYGILRPYLREFIDFCFKYFKEVNILTASKREYAEKIRAIIFPEGSPQPANVYARDQITYIDGVATKPLANFISNTRRMDNTMHLDDRREVARLNPGNLLHIPAFEPASKEALHMCDPTLPMFMRWLNSPTVRYSGDVRTLQKNNIWT